MILQTLNDLYKRLPNPPPFGFALKPLSFTLILASDGRLVDVLDEREPGEKRPIPKERWMPDILKRRAVDITPNLASDNSSYVLGRDGKGKPARAERCFASFRDLHVRLAAEVSHPMTSAVAAFVEAWRPDRFLATREIEKYREDILSGGNLAFRVQGQTGYLHEAPGVAEWWQERLKEAQAGHRGQCLVTGEERDICELHPAVKGVRGAQSTGASIVSFNLKAFESYGKGQNLNAPVSGEAAFRYATAVNWLLDADNRRRLQVGDATTVFWTARPEPIETIFGEMLSPQDTDQIQRLRALIDAVRLGQTPPEFGRSSTPFYVLGLSPNAARLSVRFWMVSSVGEMLGRVACHFEDLRIVRDRDERATHPQLEHPPLWMLLRETALLRKDENVPPTLAGAVMRSILSGTPYPHLLFTAVIGRIRADREVNYLRAALLKAVLNRNYGKEVSVSFDWSRKDPAYRLGGLFAVLEKAQQEAIPGANATIKDRFFGAASAAPATVFPRLLRLSQHHLGKLEHRVYYERKIQDLHDGVSAYPAALSLEDQGLFAVGYYHQRKELWTRRTEKEEGKGDE